MTSEDLPVFTTLDRLVELIERGDPVFVRWSRGPRIDLDRARVSKDGLTGTALPGLSANPLRLEEWWNGRPTLLWVARRLYDYSHLREEHGPGVRPWALTGEEAGRGPDNEPLVRRVRPVAWIAESVISQAEAEVARQRASWGPMRRTPRVPPGPSHTPGATGVTHDEGDPPARDSRTIS